MEINDKLTELVEYVESARSMPLSSSIVVNKQELLDRLEALRQSLPSSITAADDIVAKGEAILAEARSDAKLIVEEAHGEQLRLVSDHAIMTVARAEASRTRVEAEQAAEAAKRGVDDHIDAKLAHVELVAEKMLETARTGRERLRQGTTAYDALAAAVESYTSEAAPETAGSGGKATAVASP